jgi:hypothetical protein
MIYKWNILKKEFAKELITLYLSGAKELKNKSLEIFNPKDEDRVIIDLYIPEENKVSISPMGSMFENLFSGILETKGSIFEIQGKTCTILPIIEDSKNNPLWDKIKSLEIEDGKYKIRSIDTEDLIKDLEKLSSKQKKTFS